MLISYTLFIFALTSSVVAPPPPPHQQVPSPPEPEWEVLEGNQDLIETDRRWYKVKDLKTGKLPSWPEDEFLDVALEFTATEDAGGGAGQVSRFPFYRSLRPKEKKFELYHRGYSKPKYSVSLRDVTTISLEGFWARAAVDEEGKQAKSDPAGPVILVGDVIEIREHNKRWEFHFVGNQEILYNDYAFYPALKQYELSYKEAKFERDKGITLTKELK